MKNVLIAHSERLVNVGLRSATLGTRFLFIFFLAKYLDVDAVGYYGIFTATIGYCLYFVGLDFYIYLTREIIRAPNERRGEMLKGQAALSSALYIIIAPASLFFLTQSTWPGYLVWWFLPILLLEYFNQEVSRLLIALSEQIFASIILFVRQGSWALLAVVLMNWNAESRSLSLVMGLWGGAGLAAAALGLWKIRKLRFGGWENAIDWAWIKRGIAVSSAFLIATLALRGFQTIDRYWLETLAGIEFVGIYILFLGLAGSMLVFLDASIFAYGYPALISYNHSGQNLAARNKVRQMFFQTLSACLLFGALSWLVLPHLLSWIGNPAYLDGLFLYPWIWVGVTLNALGLVPHYGLYGAGRDRPIIYSHLAALPVFALTVLILEHFSSTLAVPMGIIAAFAFILIWKAGAYLRMVLHQSKADSSSQTQSQ